MGELDLSFIGSHSALAVFGLSVTHLLTLGHAILQKVNPESHTIAAMQMRFLYLLVGQSLWLTRQWNTVVLMFSFDLISLPFLGDCCICKQKLAYMALLSIKPT